MVPPEKQPADGIAAEAAFKGLRPAADPDVWGALRRRKSLLASGTIVGIGLACTYFFVSTPIYEARGEILVMQKDSNLPVNAVEEAGAGRAANKEDFLATQARIFRSPRVIRRAVEKRRLGQLRSLAEAGRRAREADRAFDAAELIAETLEVTCGGEAATKDARVLRATLRSPLADDSAAILSAVVESYQDFLGETFEKRRSEAVDLVAQAERELKEELEQAERAYQEFREEVPLLWEGDTIAAPHQECLRKLELEILQVRLDLAQSLIKDRRVDEVGKSESSPTELLSAHLGLLRNDLQELEKREQELRKLYKEEQESAKRLVVHRIRNERLRADIDQKRELHKAMLERLRDISLIERYGGCFTEVLSPVHAAREPASLGLAVVLGLGAVLGTLGGAGLAYVTDLADRTFHSLEHVCQTLRLPLMAHVPELRRARRNRRAARNGDGKKKLDPVIVSHHQPVSPAAETIRGLRTALFFGACRGMRRLIQVTSPNTGDGKSTITANLGVSIAQSGRRVLLIDAEMRRPMLHTLFGIENSSGLSSILAGAAELPDTIRATGVDNLWILPSGPKAANFSELLTLPRFEELLHAVRNQYEVVLVDSPALLAVCDPSVIASRVDGVLLTIRITKNGAPAAIRARELLAGLGADVLGAVVNGRHPGHKYGRGRLALSAPVLHYLGDR
ncbi:MAG: polysaccharide biosynthesis tyrosine autokinase [Planctomycetes bacterium]|nr:polysaccharide biosynthesis tyrosine autokinase [Planctomycetota bacterium]